MTAGIQRRKTGLDAGFQGDTMSNIDFSEKHVYTQGRTARQKLQFVLNVALITGAFLFVAAAVAGVFP